MKKLISILLLVLFSINAYAEDRVVVVPIGGDEVTNLIFEAKDVRSFYVENLSTSATLDVFTVPVGKTFVLNTIYSFRRASESDFRIMDSEISGANSVTVGLFAAEDGTINIDPGISFAAGRRIRVTTGINYLVFSGYLY